MPNKREMKPGSDRREFMKLLGGAAISALSYACRGKTPAGLEDRPSQALVRFPEKTELVLMTDRAPNLETPLRYFREDLTPNEAFFVRWHLPNLPTRVDLREYRLKLGGHVRRPLELTLEQLQKQFEPVSLIAVNQCAGNGRSFFEPRVPGVQWQHGSMGNARWTGVPLKALLAKAGIGARAIDVTFGGLDDPPIETVADFVKSLPVDHAVDGEALIAYEMNGQPLPMLNGFPARLVVPGWYSTYWVKALNEIAVTAAPFEGYWMKKAYRIPNTAGANEPPGRLAEETVPISRLGLRSVFVRPEPEERASIGRPFTLEGLAFDSGYGIKRVEVSTNGGSSWGDAQLGPELGKYSWRRWRVEWTPVQRGVHTLLVRASNGAGESQRLSQWNRSGYMRNVIERLEVTVL